jgi:hypothetical protein
MHSVIFNNATIYFDSPVDMHIIQGKLMIDTASYGKPKAIKEPKVAKIKATKAMKTRAPNGLTQFLRESNLKVGKKILLTANNKKTIYGAFKTVGFTASIQDTKKPNEFMVTVR